MSAKAMTLDELPLYASDEQIGAAMLGPARAREWCEIAAALVNDPHFPPVDSLYGGRYVPAVKRYYDARNGLEARSTTSAKPSGREHLERWSEKRSRRA